MAQQDAQKLFNAFAGQARDFYAGFVERVRAAYAAERVHDGVFGKRFHWPACWVPAGMPSDSWRVMRALQEQ